MKRDITLGFRRLGTQSSLSPIHFTSLMLSNNMDIMDNRHTIKQDLNMQVIRRDLMVDTLMLA